MGPRHKVKLDLRSVASRHGPDYLSNISLDLHPESVNCVVSTSLGELQTLTRLIAGQVQPSAGRIVLEIDNRVRPLTSRTVSAVFDSESLFPELTPLDNLFVGRPIAFWRHERLVRRANTIFAALGKNWKFFDRCYEFDRADLQVLALARWMATPANVHIICSAGIDEKYLNRAIGFMRAGLNGAIIIVCTDKLGGIDQLTHLHTLRDGAMTHSATYSDKISRFWPILVSRNSESMKHVVADQFQRIQHTSNSAAQLADQAMMLGAVCLKSKSVHCLYSDHTESIQATTALRESGVDYSDLVSTLRNVTAPDSPSLPETFVLGECQYTVVPLHARQNVYGVLLLERSSSPDWVSERAFVAEFSRAMQERIQEEYLRAHTEQNQRLDTLGILASGLVHDFNNTLYIIDSASRLLSRSRLDEKAAHHVDVIRDSTRSAATLTEQLLSFARSRPRATSDVDMHQIVNDAVKIIRSALPMGVTLSCELESTPAWIVGDAIALSNVLVNIGLNAVQAMQDAAGDIKLEMNSSETKGGALDLRGARMPDRCVTISVVDTGCGMSKETLRRIFEPFFTTRSNGTGLGMAVVYNSILEHRGRIDVYSELGVGTTIVITLPLSARVSAGDEDAWPAARQSLCILACDDNALLRSVQTESLRLMDFEVIETNNAYECIEVYKEKQKTIDLVILDYRLPDLNGGDCFRELIALNPHARVIMLSGHAPNSDIPQLLEEGLRGFYRKPISAAHLRRAIIDAVSTETSGSPVH